MPTAKRAVLIGATGLIGGHLLHLLENDERYSSIRLLVRRPYAPSHPKTQAYLLDFTDLEAFRIGVANSDIVFCAIGTTQQKVAGDKDAYRKIDYDIAVNAARFCKETGGAAFVLVSSVGAKAQSNNFYLKLKGEIEDAITAIGISSLSIMRPSMLLGNRKEKRTGERIGQQAMLLFNFLLPSKYKPVQATEVAVAMVNAGTEAKPGTHIYEYDALKKAAKKVLL